MDNPLKVSRFARYAIDDDGSATLLHTVTGRWLALSHVAGRFWTCCVDNLSFDDAYTSLSAHYDVPRDEIQASLETTIATLRRHRMLVKA